MKKDEKMADTKSQEKNQKSNSDSLPDESITIDKKEKIYDGSIMPQAKKEKVLALTAIDAQVTEHVQGFLNEAIKTIPNFLEIAKKEGLICEN